MIPLVRAATPGDAAERLRRSLARFEEPGLAALDAVLMARDFYWRFPSLLFDNASCSRGGGGLPGRGMPLLWPGVTLTWSCEVLCAEPMAWSVRGLHSARHRLS